MSKKNYKSQSLSDANTNESISIEDTITKASENEKAEAEVTEENVEEVSSENNDEIPVNPVETTIPEEVKEPEEIEEAEATSGEKIYIKLFIRDNHEDRIKTALSKIGFKMITIDNTYAVGPFADINDAKDARKKITGKGIKTVIINA